MGSTWGGRRAVRALVSPRGDDRLTAYVSGCVVTRSVATPARPFGLSIVTTMPHLAIRLDAGDRVAGLQYLITGALEFYVFEGVSREGPRRVSVWRPVTSHPTRPISATTAESLIEAAVSTNPYRLDSAMLAMRPGTSAIHRALSALPPATSMGKMAMPLVRNFPDRPLLRSDACPQAMILRPVLARVDQKLRVPVNAGDRVRALGRRGKETAKLFSTRRRL